MNNDLKAVDQLIAENLSLRQRVADLEQEWHNIQHMLHVAPLCFYRYDLVAQRTMVGTSRLAAMLGYTTSAALQQLEDDIIPRLLHPDDQPRFLSHVARFGSLPDAATIEFDYRLCHADGSWRWFRSRDRLFSRAADGTPQQIVGVVEDITERKKELDTMRFAQIALDHAVDAMFWVSAHGQLIAANPAACTSLGYTADELLALSIGDVDRTMSPERWRASWQMLKQREGATFETQHWHKDGTSFPVEVTTRYISVGETEYICGFARDISERKRSEVALRQSEEQLRLVLEATQVGIWDWNILTGETYYDTQWVAMLGYEPGELEGHVQTWQHLLHPDDSPHTMAVITAHMQQQSSSFVVEFRMRMKSGDWKWIEARGKVVERDAQGRACRMVGIHTDIGDRKQAEEELLMGKYALNGAFDAIEWIDNTGRFFYVNETDCRELGYTRAELLTMGVADIDPNFPAEAWDAIWSEIKQEGSIQFETVHRRKDGTVFPVEVVATYMEVAGKEWSLSIARNISERKQMEEELRRYVDIVEQTPDAISTADAQANIIMMNAAFRRLVGMEPDDDISTLRISDVHPGWILERLEQEGIPTAIREGMWSGETVLLNRATGAETAISQVILTHKHADGTIKFLSTIIRDLTAFKQAEAERAALQQEIIDAQRAALRELSAPLLPISTGVLTMPLIGTIDSTRAVQIMETLLCSVSEHHAQIAILDVTGVQVVDTQVANAIIQTAQAVRLLGAQVVLTGIGPAMAQTLVHLGVDLSSIVTCGNLQAGIAYALNRKSKS